MNTASEQLQNPFLENILHYRHLHISFSTPTKNNAISENIPYFSNNLRGSGKLLVAYADGSYYDYLSCMIMYYHIERKINNFFYIFFILPGLGCGGRLPAGLQNPRDGLHRNFCHTLPSNTIE